MYYFLDLTLSGKSRFLSKRRGSLLESETVPRQVFLNPGGARSRFLKGSRRFFEKTEIYSSASHPKISGVWISCSAADLVFFKKGLLKYLRRRRAPPGFGKPWGGTASP